MIRSLGVAIKTRIPFAATLELDRDNIEVAVPMAATSFGINVYPMYICSVDGSLHLPFD